MTRQSRPTAYLIFDPSSLKYFTPYREVWTFYAEDAEEFASYRIARHRANELGRDQGERLEIVQTEEIG